MMNQQPQPQHVNNGSSQYDGFNFSSMSELLPTTTTTQHNNNHHHSTTTNEPQQQQQQSSQQSSSFFSSPQLSHPSPSSFFSIPNSPSFFLTPPSSPLVISSPTQFTTPTSISSPITTTTTKQSPTTTTSSSSSPPESALDRFGERFDDEEEEELRAIPFRSIHPSPHHYHHQHQHHHQFSHSSPSPLRSSNQSPSAFLFHHHHHQQQQQQHQQQQFSGVFNRSSSPFPSYSPLSEHQSIFSQQQQQNRFSSSAADNSNNSNNYHHQLIQTKIESNDATIEDATMGGDTFTIRDEEEEEDNELVDDEMMMVNRRTRKAKRNDGELDNHEEYDSIKGKLKNLNQNDGDENEEDDNGGEAEEEDEDLERTWKVEHCFIPKRSRRGSNVTEAPSHHQFISPEEAASQIHIQLSTRDEVYTIVPEILYSSLRYVFQVSLHTEPRESIMAQLYVVEDENHENIVTRSDGKSIMDPDPGLVQMAYANGSCQCGFKVKVTENSSNRNGMKFAFKICLYSYDRNHTLLLDVTSPGFIVKSRRDPRSKRTTDATIVKKQKNASVTSNPNVSKQVKSSPSTGMMGQPIMNSNMYPQQPQSQTSMPFDMSHQRFAQQPLIHQLHPQNPIQPTHIFGQPSLFHQTRSESPVDKLISLVQNHNSSDSSSSAREFYTGSPYAGVANVRSSAPSPLPPPSPKRLSKQELSEIMRMGDVLREKLSNLSDNDKKVALLYLQNELFEGGG